LFGRGAWELVARWAYLDLTSDNYFVSTNADRSAGTGTLHDMVVGVNWYWNPNFKMLFNYNKTWRDSDTPGRSGIVDGFGFRFAWDF
jgi:phosphate-selective porin